MTERPALIFHHPLPIDDDPRVGSTTHVTRMLEGFVAAGYDVEQVVGYSKDRLQAMRSLRSQIRDGRRFDFLYAEASTAPTAMNDPNHLPFHPFMDWRFLRFVKRNDIPVGLFYPDVYWRFPVYVDAVPAHKRWPVVCAYRFDLRWYRRVLDVLFLPSQRMQRSIPGWESSDRVMSLPPGGVGEALPAAPANGALQLFYVGSVAPPLYDITPLLDAVRQLENVEVTICCPHTTPALEAAVRSCDRIRVVHEHGDQVQARYSEAQIACLVFAHEPYRAFAMPVKLFEAIAAGRPVLASGDTAVGEFIAATEVGWVVDDDVLVDHLRLLASSPEEVERCRQQVLAQRGEHTWAARARHVASTLTRQLSDRFDQ